MSSQQSTTRSRAMSRRLAQQASSSDEDVVVKDGSGATTTTTMMAAAHRLRPRPKQNKKSLPPPSGQERAESQSRESSDESPLQTRAPVYFPSFQSQNTQTQPDDDGMFSALPVNLLHLTTASREPGGVASRDNHVIPEPDNHPGVSRSNDQRAMSQEHGCSQPTSDPSLQQQSHVSHDSFMTSSTRSHEPRNTFSLLTPSNVASHDTSHDQVTPLTSALLVQDSTVAQSSTEQKQNTGMYMYVHMLYPNKNSF